MDSRQQELIRLLVAIFSALKYFLRRFILLGLKYLLFQWLVQYLSSISLIAGLPESLMSPASYCLDISGLLVRSVKICSNSYSRYVWVSRVIFEKSLPEVLLSVAQVIKNPPCDGEEHAELSANSDQKPVSLLLLKSMANISSKPS